MKKYNLILITILSFLLIIILSACSKRKDIPTYVNNDYGFSIELPESWEGEFEVVPYDHRLVISSESNDIKTLAYIQKHTIEEWKHLNNGEDIPIQFQILGENSEAIFILAYPGDVNYNIENENSVKRNEEMRIDLMEEKFIFSFLEQERKKGKF